MKVLIAGINPLHYHLQVGSHFYAREFDRDGHEVTYLSEPFNVLHFLKNGFNEANRIRWQVWRERGRKFGARGLAFTPLGLIPNFGFYPLSAPSVVRLSQRSCFPSPEKFLAEKGISEVDLIWIDNVYYAPCLEKIPHRSAIYRLADSLADYGRYGAYHAALEREILGKVDLAFGVTSALVRKAQEARPGKPTFLLPNGVDFAPFQKVGLEPEAYRRIPRPRVVFVGVLNNTYSPELIFTLARRLPHFSFVLIGPKAPSLHLPQLENLYHLGPIPYDNLPPYLQHADVGLAPRAPTLVQAVTLPLKALQYMACGLPYVSSSYEAEDFHAMGKPPGFYAKSEEEMISMLQDAVALSQAERQVFRDFAAKNSWGHRYREVIGRLRETCGVFLVEKFAHEK